MSQCFPLYSASMISPSKGFTFLEILVVLILIAICASLVGINVGKSTGEKRTVFFVKTVRFLCVKARQRALISGVPETFVISGSERACWVVPASKTEIPSHITIEGEKLQTEDEDRYLVRFFPDGSSSGGILFFKVNEETVFRMKINTLTGLIELIHDTAA